MINPVNIANIIGYYLQCSSDHKLYSGDQKQLGDRKQFIDQQKSVSTKLSWTWTFFDEVSQQDCRDLHNLQSFIRMTEYFLFVWSDWKYYHLLQFTAFMYTMYTWYNLVDEIAIYILAGGFICAVFHAQHYHCTYNLTKISNKNNTRRRVCASAWHSKMLRPYHNDNNHGIFSWMCNCWRSKRRWDVVGRLSIQKQSIFQVHNRVRTF